MKIGPKVAIKFQHRFISTATSHDRSEILPRQHGKSNILLREKIRANEADAKKKKNASRFGYKITNFYY